MQKLFQCHIFLQCATSSHTEFNEIRCNKELFEIHLTYCGIKPLKFKCFCFFFTSAVWSLLLEERSNYVVVWSASASSVFINRFSRLREKKKDGNKELLWCFQYKFKKQTAEVEVLDLVPWPSMLVLIALASFWLLMFKWIQFRLHR